MKKAAALRYDTSKEKSPRVVANAIARFGPSIGAITIAPTITATLFSKRPIAATTVESIIKII